MSSEYHWDMDIFIISFLTAVLMAKILDLLPISSVAFDLNNLENGEVKGLAAV